ncbi:MAG: sugar ABC transporter substrate-binding protein, partial [Treponema sp.]|nr:sugar ABC transporter substrate-binding protein [Treponema sp.]
PAIQSGVDKALATYKTKGYDVSAFTDEAVAPDGTFLYPIVDHSVEIGQIMTRVFDQIFLGEKAVEPALKDANAEVKALFN